MFFRRLIIIGFIALLLILGAVWFFLRPTGTVEFAVAPETVTAAYNKESRDVKNGEKLQLTPGTYKMTFSRAGFVATTKTVTVTNKKSVRILIALVPLTDQAKQELAASSSSAAIVKEYQAQRYQDFIASLPLATTDFKLSACPPVKDPDSTVKAICVTTSGAAGATAARSYIASYGVDIDTAELLVGSEHIKNIIKTDRYQVDFYPTAKIEGTTKKISLTITPLGVPYVAYNAPRNAQLETIRTDALADMKNKGYDPADYDIFYANVYLSRYNPDIHSAAEHAMPPVQ